MAEGGGLDGDYIRAFGLASNDWFIRDSLVGIAEQRGCKPRGIPISEHIEACPSIVELAVNAELQAQITAEKMKAMSKPVFAVQSNVDGVGMPH
jgi:hypothetical protein